MESAAVEQPLAQGSRVVLFVALREGGALDEDLAARIRARIAERASPRHVPDLIVQAPELPRTATGKVSELAVRDALCGRPVKGEQSLANPSCLDFFRAFGAKPGAAGAPAPALLGVLP
jgi:acetoacetyl-CoA synthetase